MTRSPTPAELLAIRTGNAALLNSPNAACDVVATIVFALGSAQLLQSPESAAEADALRRDLDAFRDQRNAVFATNEELLARVQRSGLELLQTQNENRTLTREMDRLRARVAELEAAAGDGSTRSVDEDPIAYSLTERAADVPRHIGRGQAARFCVECTRIADEHLHDMTRRPVVICPGDDVAPDVEALHAASGAVIAIPPTPVRRSASCPACGESETTWCPDCACCRLGCYGGQEDNPCTHPNATWSVTP